MTTCRLCVEHWIDAHKIWQESEYLLGYRGSISVIWKIFFFGIAPKPSLSLPQMNPNFYLWYKVAEIQNNYLAQSSADVQNE
jgi:hypothetical protein